VDIFDPNQRSDIDQDTVRLGTRYRLSPASDLLLSGVYSDRSSSQKTELVLPGFSLPLVSHIDDQAYQAEAQYLRRFIGGSLIAGFGRYRVDRRLRRGVGDPPAEDENIDG